MRIPIFSSIFVRGNPMGLEQMASATYNGFEGFYTKPDFLREKVEQNVLFDDERPVVQHLWSSPGHDWMKNTKVPA